MAHEAGFSSSSLRGPHSRVRFAGTAGTEQLASFSGCGKKPFPDCDVGAQALAPRGRRPRAEVLRASMQGRARSPGGWGGGERHRPGRRLTSSATRPLSSLAKSWRSRALRSRGWGRGQNRHREWEEVMAPRRSAADDLLLLKFAIFLRMLAKIHFVPI